MLVRLPFFIIWIAPSALWAQVTVSAVGPEGGSFLSLAAAPQNPGTLYAGAQYAGVFKTTDAGAHWIATGLAGFTVKQLAIDPNNPGTVYAGAFQETPDSDAANIGVFKTMDGGRTWARANLRFGVACGIVGLIVDPQTAGTVYVLSSCDGVFRSVDAGDTWQPANSGLLIPHPGGWFAAMMLEPVSSTLYVSTEQCDTTGRQPPPACDTHLFKSQDAGGSWTESTAAPLSGTMFNILAIDPANPNVLYARGMYPYVQNTVFKSTDAGASWIRTSLDLGMGCCIDALAIDQRSNIYAAGFRGLFKSTDGGANWSVISYFPMLSGIAAVVFDPQTPDTIYVADGSGVSRSIDGGESWSPARSGLRAAPVFSIALDSENPGAIYAGGFGISKSSDAGATWTAGASDAPGFRNFAYALTVDPSQPGTVYAGVGGYGDFSGCCGAILKSVDSGLTWSAAQNGLTTASTVLRLAVDTQNPGTVYAATSSGGIFKSTDYAATWSAANAGLPTGPPPILALTLPPEGSGELYTAIAPGAGSGPGIFKTTDGAGSWSRLTQDLSPLGAPCCAAVTVLVADSSGTIYAVSHSVSSVTIWKTADGGATWRDLHPAASGNIWALAVSAQTPGVVYASTDSGLIMTADGGETWALVPGAPAMALSIAVDPHTQNTVYAAGWFGLFTITISAPE